MNIYRLESLKTFYSVKNYFLDILKNPKKLSIYLILIISVLLYIYGIKDDSISFIQFLNVSFNSISSTIKNGSISTEKEMYLFVNGSLNIFIVSFFTIHLLIFNFSRKIAFFHKADINFIFTLPVSPQKILLSKLLKFLIEDIKNNGFTYIPLFLIPFIINILVTSVNPISFIVYFVIVEFVLILFLLKLLYFNFKHKINLNKITFYAASSYILFILVGIISSENTKDFILNYSNNFILDFFPLFSWLKSFYMLPLSNYSAVNSLSLLLLTALGIILFYLFYNSSKNYYEQVVTNPEKYEKDSFKLTNDKKVKITNKLKIDNSLIPKFGIKAYLWKNKIEKSRNTILKFVSIENIVIICLSSILVFTVRMFPMKHPEKLVFIPIFLNIFIFLSFLLINSIKSNLYEFTKHYIYLIPGTNFKKIIYSNIQEIQNMTINIIAINLIIYLFLPIKLLYISLLAFNIIILFFNSIFSNIIARYLINLPSNQQSLFFMTIALKFIIGILPQILIIYIFHFISNYSFITDIEKYLSVFYSTNIIAVIILGFISNNIFDKLELK